MPPPSQKAPTASPSGVERREDGSPGSHRGPRESRRAAEGARPGPRRPPRRSPGTLVCAAQHGRGSCRAARRPPQVRIDLGVNCTAKQRAIGVLGAPSAAGARNPRRPRLSLSLSPRSTPSPAKRRWQFCRVDHQRMVADHPQRVRADRRRAPRARVAHPREPPVHRPERAPPRAPWAPRHHLHAQADAQRRHLGQLRTAPRIARMSPARRGSPDPAR